MTKDAGNSQSAIRKSSRAGNGAGARSSRPLLLAGAAQLLTLRGARAPRRRLEMRELGIIEDGAVLINGGRVVTAGPSNELRRNLRAQAGAMDVLDVSGKVVMPAFVDSHTHMAFAAPRLSDFEMRLAGATYEQIAAAGGGIHSSCAHLREAGRRALLPNLVYFAQQAASYGTGTVEVKSGYGLDPDSELMLLDCVASAKAVVGVELVPTFLGAHAVPRGQARAKYVRQVIEEMLPRVAQAKLAEFCDVFCDHLAFTVRDAARILQAAARLGLKAKLHGEQLEHTGAALLAVRLAAASVDHLERAGPRDIQALARSGTVGTLLPGATFFLGRHDYAPARALIDGGAAVALATDFNPGTSPSLNMQMMMSLACTQMRMTPAEAVVASTVNAAFAVARGDRMGSIERGMQADIAVFDLADYREIPYYFGMNHCWATIKRGRVVYCREPLA